MKVSVLTVLFSVAACPFAVAAESAADCELDETRREAHARAEPAPPAPPAARPTLAQREAEAQPARPERRRNGRPIPDAELIGPRGAL